METNSRKLSIWVFTILGLAIGLIIGIILIDFKFLPEEADAQVYVALSLIIGATAFLIGNRNIKKNNF